MEDGGGGSLILSLFSLMLSIVSIVAMWRVFEKAGQPGWASIIPIYNIYVMCEIAGKPGWWLILFFVPIVGIVVAALVSISIAEGFNKGVGFGIGLLLLPFIFYSILAFTDAEYA